MLVVAPRPPGSTSRPGPDGIALVSQQYLEKHVMIPLSEYRSGLVRAVY